MPNSWNVTVTAPNGTKSDFTMDAAEDEQKIVDFFASCVRTYRANDPEPITGIPGIPPAAQPSRKP